MCHEAKATQMVGQLRQLAPRFYARGLFINVACAPHPLPLTVRPAQTAGYAAAQSSIVHCEQVNTALITAMAASPAVSRSNPSLLSAQGEERKQP
jgi:hypothetical protein